MAIERSKYAEFVAVRIGHHHPTDVVGLADVDAPGTQSFKPKDFSSLIEGSQVKVQAIRPVFFPLLLRLYQPERGASKPELARAMTGIFARAMHPRRVHLVADAAYRSKLWRALPSGRSFTTRLAANATLYAPAPPPTGKRGRPATKGAKLGKPADLAAVAADPDHHQLYGDPPL